MLSVYLISRVSDNSSHASIVHGGTVLVSATVDVLHGCGVACACHCSTFQ